MDLPEPPPDGYRRWHRRLPHHENPGASYALVFRLADSSACNLCHERIAPIIIDALHFFHETRYLLFDYVVMPDHVHLILKPLKRSDGRWHTLSDIKHSLRSWTANQINRRLQRTGGFWQDEAYDHSIRNERDQRETAHYIWTNPVRAGLVTRPEDWPWTGHGSHRRSAGQDGLGAGD